MLGARRNTGFIEQFKNEGIFMFTDNKFRVGAPCLAPGTPAGGALAMLRQRCCCRWLVGSQINGRDTVRTNPFSIRADGQDSLEDSYIYKSEK